MASGHPGAARAGWSGLVTCLLLGVAACGGSSGTSATTTAPATTSPATTSPATSTPATTVSGPSSPPNFQFLGWSTAGTEIDGASSATNKPPAGLVPSGGTIHACGATRLVMWIAYDSATTPFSSSFVIRVPSGAQSVSNGTHPAGTGTLDQWIGHSGATPFGTKDQGTYVGELRYGPGQDPVAGGSVVLAC